MQQQRKSSIHIIASSPAALLHNERVFSVDYAIDSEDKNAYKRIRSPREYRSAAIKDYTSNTGQKYQKRAAPIREAVINLLPHHTLNDVQQVANMLQEKYNIEPLHLSIHNDEGHVVNNEKIYNHHAHIVLGWHDFDTHKSVKLNRTQMKRMQTDVAKVLRMERGKENSNRVRLNHQQYKEAMRLVEEKTGPLLLTIDELKSVVKELREELKTEKAKRPQYAALEQFKKEIERQIAAGDLVTRERFDEEIDALREQLALKDARIKELQSAAAAAPSPFDLEAALAATAAEKRKREEAERRASAAEKKTKEIYAAAKKALSKKNEQIAALQAKITRLKNDLLRAQKHFAAASTASMQQRQAQRRIHNLQDQLKNFTEFQNEEIDQTLESVNKTIEDNSKIKTLDDVRDAFKAFVEERGLEDVLNLHLPHQIEP